MKSKDSNLYFSVQVNVKSRKIFNYAIVCEI